MITDKKIITYSVLPLLSKRLKKNKNKIILTTGCFDFLHFGHIVHLAFCKKQGDVLVVSVGNDKTLKMLKGKNRPLYSQKVRAQMLASLEIVDYVVMSKEIGIMDHSVLVTLLKPDIYVVPKTDSMLSKKSSLVKQNGGKVITCKRTLPKELHSGISTTIIEKIISNEL